MYICHQKQRLDFRGIFIDPILPLELGPQNLYIRRCARKFLKILIENFFCAVAYAYLCIKIQQILTFPMVLSLQTSKFTKNWFTMTPDDVEFFQNIFEFLRFVWNPKTFFGFHNIEKSKNRVFWIIKCLKKFEKIIFTFSTQKSSYILIFRFFQAVFVFLQDFHENIEKPWNKFF